MNKLLISLYRNYKLFIALIRRDLTASYSGSVAGSTWVIIDPLIYIMLTLMFFQFAIRGADTGGVPYVAWVLPAIIFWTFINNVIGSAVSAVREYSYLLRHRNFDMRLVLLIKIASASFVHFIVMMVVMLALIFVMDVKLTLQTFAVFYYYVSSCFLLLAIGWLLSALGVFWKDIRNIVGILLQIGFWMSPIFWEPDRFPKIIGLIMYANPFYYPIHGYRSSILSNDFGPHFLVTTIYFWVLTFSMLWLCSSIFGRLSKNFGDEM